MRGRQELVGEGQCLRRSTAESARCQNLAVELWSMPSGHTREIWQWWSNSGQSNKLTNAQLHKVDPDRRLTRTCTFEMAVALYASHEQCTCLISCTDLIAKSRAPLPKENAGSLNAAEVHTLASAL